MTTYEVTASIWLLPAIVNGDTSGLEPDDLVSLKEFNDFLYFVQGYGHSVVDLPPDIDAEKYFGTCEFGRQLGDVLDFEVHVFNENDECRQIHY